jgi:hypothetical protein
MNKFRQNRTIEEEDDSNEEGWMSDESESPIKIGKRKRCYINSIGSSDDNDSESGTNSDCYNIDYY